MAAYYNEHEPYAAQWLRNLIKAGLIADGEVDQRSIVDVSADDLRGFAQCHFFAGLGGWSHALRLAGWPDGREVWTGSPPCQPFSVAGKQKAQDDARHLWPTFFNLIRAARPPVLMGEQVAAAVGKGWLDGVSADLESIGYTCRAAIVPACAVDAPHRRDRVWFVADANDSNTRQSRDARAAEGERRARWADADNGGAYFALADAGSGRRGGSGEGQDQLARGTEAVGSGDGDVGHANGTGREQHSGPVAMGAQFISAERRGGGAWATHQWAIGADGKARRVEPGIRLLAHGVPARVGRLRAYGNAIVPQVAAQVIGAFMEARP